MRNRTELLATTLLTAVLSFSLSARASAPTPAAIVTLDADSRAEGNRIDVARRIGDALFRTRWPAQVTKVAADGVGGHVVVELRLSGVKFHRPLTRGTFLDEVAALIATTRSAVSVAEIDVAAEEPIGEGKGVVVSGDLAKPTSRTVFTISVLRGESPAALRARLTSGKGVYWDEEWAKAVLKVVG